jgi:hypothetical protein
VVSLRLRALRLLAYTEDGEFGRDLRFDDGLVVLRAENSMGKTTAVNSVLYALGMEGLIAQRQGVPLTAAMTSQLQAPNGRVLTVSESRVLLEVENHEGRVATLERFAKRQLGDTRMIRVWHARRVSAPTPDDRYEDVLARVAGSGTGEMGIGPWLERFVGWDLPTIVMPDGGERRLYPELLLSLIFVEQRAGWRGIQAAMPTYGIPDVRKRAREYLLGLEVYERERRRLALRQQREEIRRAWDSALMLAGARLGAVGLRLTDTDADVDADFGDQTPLRVVDVQTGGALDQERAAVGQELSELAGAPDTDRTPETVQTDESRLRELEAGLQTATLDARERERELARLRSEQMQLGEQDRRLREDLTRNQDAQRLQSFGGQPWATEERDCPTCHQSLPETLIGTLDRPTMTVEQNIAYIRQQMEVIDAARERAAAEIELTSHQQTAARRAISETRAEVRALRDALVRPHGVPSAADVQRRLTLQRRHEDLEAADVEVGALRDELRAVAARANENRAALAALPPAGLSTSDEATLTALETSFLSQLREYRPQSVPLADLGISRDSYLPAAGNVDLAFEISASDGIRLVWAYLLGLLESARAAATNHPGLVVFDEPRQQSAGDRSLERLLARASGAGAAGQQVLFATSEPRARLEPMLEGLPVQYLPIDDRLLAPRG